MNADESGGDVFATLSHAPRDDDGSPLPSGRDYCIINAESIEDAEKLLEGCPIIDAVRIYEAASM